VFAEQGFDFFTQRHFVCQLARGSMSTPLVHVNPRPPSSAGIMLGDGVLGGPHHPASAPSRTIPDPDMSVVGCNEIGVRIGPRRDTASNST
jgi:hypothetical protein